MSAADLSPIKNRPIFFGRRATVEANSQLPAGSFKPHLFGNPTLLRLKTRDLPFRDLVGLLKIEK
jgi:hypothetical protein